MQFQFIDCYLKTVTPYLPQEQNLSENITLNKKDDI